MEGTVIGNWTVERELGEGGMGKVYLARHKHLNSVAALKVLYGSLTQDQSFRERFLHEAQTQSLLQHPNIARVMDYIEQQNQYYLVVEYLAGGTLADVIDNSQAPIDQARAINWARQALLALDYAHQRRVIHRDIKPSNIMFDESGIVKVMDFGIALVMGGKRLTSTGVTMGTPEYMSPEQIVRPKELDHRTDVYSMGIVLYEMLAGRAPFQGDTDFSIRAAQVNDPPPPLRYVNPAISEGLQQVVMKALAKDPNQRYSGCGEFIAALDHGSISGALNYVPPAQPYNTGGPPPTPTAQTPQYGYGSGGLAPNAPPQGYRFQAPAPAPPPQPGYNLTTQRIDQPVQRPMLATPCKMHPGAAAIAACVRCRAPYCQTCLVNMQGQPVCHGCARSFQFVPPGSSATYANSAATEALIFALVGFVCFFLGFIIQPIAIYKAVKAKREIRANPAQTGNGKATAALIIAIVGLCIMGIYYLGILVSMINNS